MGKEVCTYSGAGKRLPENIILTAYSKFTGNISI
jgi:hypothetical protein